MLRKNNFFLLILSEIIFLFFIIIVLPSVFLKEKPGISQVHFENTLPLDKNHTYFQKLISDRNNLNSISILLKNPALKSNDLVEMEIQDQDKNILQQLQISGVGIEDPGWVRFKFPFINSKKGDILYIKVTSNSQKDNNLYIYGDKDNKNINFKTTFVSTTLKESYQDTISEQLIKINQMNKTFLLFYIFILITANIILFLNYENKKTKVK